MAATHLEDLSDRIRPKAAYSLLLWLIFAFLASFGVWASVVRLDRVVHAPGRVVPTSRLQVLSNLEGGVVEAILVHAGDIVQQGQPLVRLDRTQAGADFGSSEILVGALAAKIARLKAEIGGQAPQYPVAATAEIAEQIEIERLVHIARLNELASLTAAAAAREMQAERAVGEARAGYDSRVSARAFAKSQVAIIRPLVERGIEPRMTLLQLESNAAVAASDAAQAAAAIALARARVAEAKANLAQVRGAWRAQAGTDLAAAQSEMAARRRSMPVLAEKLGRSIIRSPVDGRVNRVLIATVGGSVGPGQAILEVVPSAKALTVEALVNPKDIAAVRIGQRARINITAYDSAVYGGMEGRVLTISPDATADERTGESHYTVRIRVDSQAFRSPSGQALVVGPGMTADVNLIGSKRSVMAYILTPFSRLREDALRE